MGSYREVLGDLLELFENGHFDVIAHGANCRAIMGAGIAGQIKKRYPIAYSTDIVSKVDSSTKMNVPGDLSIAKTSDGLIVNLYTQHNPGNNFSIEYLKESLDLFSKIFNPKLKVGLPLIGCGIGGGNQDVVIPVIKKKLSKFDVTLVHYNR